MNDRCRICPPICNKLNENEGTSGWIVCFHLIVSMAYERMNSMLNAFKRLNVKSKDLNIAI